MVEYDPTTEPLIRHLQFEEELEYRWQQCRSEEFLRQRFDPLRRVVILAPRPQPWRPWEG